MIKSIDHMVITTADLNKCLHFYADLLGMTASICMIPTETWLK